MPSSGQSTRLGLETRISRTPFGPGTSSRRLGSHVSHGIGAVYSVSVEIVNEFPVSKTPFLMHTAGRPNRCSKDSGDARNGVLCDHDEQDWVLETACFPDAAELRIESDKPSVASPFVGSGLARLPRELLRG